MAASEHEKPRTHSAKKPAPKRNKALLEKRLALTTLLQKPEHAARIITLLTPAQISAFYAGDGEVPEK